MSLVLAILVVMAIALPLYIYLMQDRLLFHPQPLSQAQRLAIQRLFQPVKEIVLADAGTKLQAWYVKGAPGKPLVLYFGGNAEEVSWMLEAAHSRLPGFGWLLVSYRGYGGSEGAPSEDTITADALRWYDYAVQELGAAQVIAFGRSLGSGAAVFLASQRPVHAVILVTPYDSLVQVAQRHYPYLPVRLLLRHRFESIERAPALHMPLLCIAAGRDQVIPPEHARRLFDAWGGPKKWVELEEAGHNTTDDYPLFWQSVTSFLVRMRP